jgi:hypothetical protein
MKNESPVFVCGFTRGGTNILMNILLSHPNLCKPTGETHQVFRGRYEESIWRILQRRISYDMPIRLLSRDNFFDPYNYNERPNIPEVAQWLIDNILYVEKTLAQSQAQNRLKHQGVRYTKAEVANSRLLSKNINGVIFLTPVLQKMYPDATFLGLVRDGRALCESHLRRGYSVKEVADLYRNIANRMLKYHFSQSNFYLVFFEDMISEPKRIIEKVYNKVEIDTASVRGIRLQIKSKLKQNGKHVLESEKDRKMVWYDPENLDGYFDDKINEHHIKKLDNDKQEKFEKLTEGILSKMGYIKDDRTH